MKARGGIIMIGTIVWAVILGVIFGYLGKLLLPGRQNIPAWATIGAGIVAVLIGGLIANGLHWGGFWTFVLRIVFAIVAVALVAMMFSRSRGMGNTTRTR
jgi:uncharacterized membrane protein YeaQ/YmgE (transglycosylase-associated protein family)